MSHALRHGLLKCRRIELVKEVRVQLRHLGGYEVQILLPVGGGDFLRGDRREG